MKRAKLNEFEEYLIELRKEQGHQFTTVRRVDFEDWSNKKLGKAFEHMEDRGVVEAFSYTNCTTWKITP